MDKSDCKQSKWVDPSEIQDREMTILIRNEQRHMEVIDYLLALLEKNNITISDENIKDYLNNIGKYDCMWEDYKNFL